MKSSFEIFRSGRQKEKNDLVLTLLCCLCLAFIGYLLYAPMVRLGLFDDDRGVIELLRKLNWFEYFSENDGFRFRPISQMAISTVWQLCGCRPIRFIHVIPVLNVCLGIALFFLADYLFKNRLLSFAIGTAYLTARFAYYQVLQLLGIMEGTALFCALATLLFAVDFAVNARNRSIWFACLFYLLALYSHERYLTLVAVLLVAVWVRSYKKGDKNALTMRRRLAYTAVALAACGLSFVLRIVLFHGNVWTGTNGMDMRSTFSVKTVIDFVVKQVLYLMGWGATDTYLSGLSYVQVGKAALAATAVYDLCFAGLLAMTFLAFRKDRRENRYGILQAIALVVVFVGACIIASSTTIRVEMRWVYVSYAALLIGVGMMAAYCLHATQGRTRMIACVLATAFFLSACFIEFSYRKGWRAQYYYAGLVEDESLVEAIRDYPDIPNRDLVIIDPKNQVDTVRAAQLLSDIQVDDMFAPMSVTRLDTIEQYEEQVDSDDLLVEYKDGRYRDITGVLNPPEERRVIAGAQYPDGWCTSDVTFEIIPRGSSDYELKFYTNHDVSGYSEEERTVYISVNGELCKQFVYEEGLQIADVCLPLDVPSEVNVRTGFVSGVNRDGLDLSYVLEINRL